MDSKIANQFVRATTSIFGQVSNFNLVKGEQQYFPEGCKCAAKIAIILGVFGDIKGQFFLLMDEPMAMKLTSATMAGVTTNYTGEIIDSVVREFCNMIGGEAIKRLLEIDLNCDMTFPSIVRCKDIETTTPSFICKFESEWGEMQQILKFDYSSQIK